MPNSDFVSFNLKLRVFEDTGRPSGGAADAVSNWS